MEELDYVAHTAPGDVKKYDLHIARLPSGNMVDIHIFVYRGLEDGPVLLLTGGLHGDEVNGIEIVRRLMTEDFLHPQHGTVITIPVLNIYGFLNFARDLPDGKDANRSFPGIKNGSLASRMAYSLKNRILPLIDYGIDFHTGGGNRSNYPQVRCEFEDEGSMRLAKAFAPPFILHSNLIPQSLRNEAKSMGKCMIVYEGGQSLRFDELAIEEGIAGTRRLMKELNMLPEEADAGAGHESVMLPRSSWVRAEVAGLFHPAVEIGSYLEAQQLIGTITDPYNTYEVPINAVTAGYILGLNNSPVINAGDALVHIGNPSETLTVK